MKWLYLVVDLCSFIPTLLFSFHPKIKFYQHWKYAIPAIFGTAIPFIIWDIYYTRLGVWGFNPRCISGIYIANLPVEEILFFLCIPYACLYTYFCFNKFIVHDYLKQQELLISCLLLCFLFPVSIYFFQHLYTSVTFVLLGFLLLFLQFKLKVSWLSRVLFAYTFLLIPFTIVNGILTGSGIEQEVVWYNPSHIIGVRLLTIPMEDIFYGLLMFIGSVSIYEALKNRFEAKTVS